jgi:glutaredoxin-related protein
MNPEDIRSALNAALSDKNVLSLWQIVLLTPICGFAAYVGAYLKRRGENLATKEDIREVTNAVQQIEIAYAREIESHKIDLLKSKAIYEEQLKAYSKFIGLVYQIRPHMSHLGDCRA